MRKFVQHLAVILGLLFGVWFIFQYGDHLCTAGKIAYNDTMNLNTNDGLAMITLGIILKVVSLMMAIVCVICAVGFGYNTWKVIRFKVYRASV